MIIIQLIKLLRKKIPKPVLFIILRYAGYEFHFSEEVILETDPHKIVKRAAEVGNFNLFIKYKKNCDYNIMFHACLGANMRIIKYIIENENFNYSSGLAGACIKFDKDLMKKMTELGATLEGAYEYICEKGDIKTVEHYYDTTFSPLIFSLSLAACINKKKYDIVDFLVDKGAVTSSYLVNQIVRCNNIEGLKYLDRNYFRGLKEDVIEISILNNYITMINACIELGCNNFTYYENIAIEEGRDELAQFFHKLYRS